MMVFNPYLNKKRPGQGQQTGAQVNQPAKPQGSGASQPYQQRYPGQDKNAQPAALGLPPNYLANGYFDETGNIWPELLLAHARDIAKAIGQNPPGIKNAQLRKFYGHVKAADTRLNYDVDFADVRASVLELASFVAEAKGKGKVPQCFKDFIDVNLAHVHDKASFRNGFVKHFQAVVGYFGYFDPRD